MEFYSALLLILYAYLISTILHGIVFPSLALSTHRYLPDLGWALSRPVGWLLVGLFIWIPAHAFPLNTTPFLFLVLSALLVASFSLLFRHRSKLLSLLQSRWLYIAVHESLFLFGFVSLSLIRAYNPDILDLEKFMDAGFINSYLRATQLPAPDIWLAGSTINYYSFGHFLGSILSRLWQLDVGLSYNLILAFIAGLSLSLCSLIVTALASLFRGIRPRIIIISGIVGAFLAIIAGNTHTIAYVILNRSFDNYWYADATRFIQHTIHEFPSYSFVVADIHAHVWNLPFVLTALVFVIIWVRTLSDQSSSYLRLTISRLHLSFLHPFSFSRFPSKAGYLVSSAIIGILLGTFIMTSSWDALIYPILIALTGSMLFIAHPALLLRLIASALTMIAFMLSTASLWLVNFTSISEGVAAVIERSPLNQFLQLWSLHLLLTFFAFFIILTAFRWFSPHAHHLSGLIIAGFILTSWLLLVLPELIYVKDIYTGHPRANTMFKLTYQAFILMSLIGGWLTAVVLHFPKRRIFKLILVLPILLIILSLSPFPSFAYKGYYGNFATFKGLYGYGWLQAEFPTDYNGILWIQANVAGQPTILEAVGESYTKYNRVSALTGLPTVLGWRVHEWLWRGGFDIPSQRTSEVQTIYTNPISPEANRLLDLYQVEFIFIGHFEYEAHQELDLPGLLSLGTTVFNDGSTYIIKRNAFSQSEASTSDIQF